MNYIVLLGLILGIISIYIVINYNRNYHKINKQLKKACRKKKILKFPDSLGNIKLNLNLSNKEFIKKLRQNKEQIIRVLSN